VILNACTTLTETYPKAFPIRSDFSLPKNTQSVLLLISKFLPLASHDFSRNGFVNSVQLFFPNSPMKASWSGQRVKDDVLLSLTSSFLSVGW
jgi:hypothetical protein